MGLAAIFVTNKGNRNELLESIGTCNKRYGHMHKCEQIVKPFLSLSPSIPTDKRSNNSTMLSRDDAFLDRIARHED